MQPSEGISATVNELRAELEQAKRALQASEGRFRNIIERNADGIIVVGRDGLVRFVNQAATALLGRQADQLVGELFGFPVVAADLTELDIWGGGYPTVAEMRVVESEWDGEPVYLASLRDITHRKQSEKALQQSEQKFRSVIEQSYDGIVLTDEQGLIIEWNRAIEEITGLKASEVVGRPIWETQIQLGLEIEKSPEQYRQLKTITLEALALGQAPWLGRLSEREYRYPDGARRTIQGLVFPIKTDKGYMLGSIWRDVTARKLVEERLKAALAQKEMLVKEIHHRVKNNLTIVSSLLELKADLVEDETARQVLLESQNRVLTMARIHEHLYHTEDLAGVGMAEYVQSLVDHLQASYGAYAITFVVEVADITLEVDKAIPCGLIINELVSNALKYAFPADKLSADRRGEIRVELYPQPGDEGEERLVLVVSDNGRGLPPDFDWRNLSSLGLKLVQTLVQQFGGSIECDGSRGTSFKLVLPNFKPGPQPDFPTC
jgi:PAS domain S-box-containing protein